MTARESALEVQLSQAYGLCAELRRALQSQKDCCPSCMILRSRLRAVEEQLATKKEADA